VSTRAGTDQTVYIDKNLTLEGGHTYKEWSEPPDPDTYPTTLDADEMGRVAVIKGNMYVTLEALHFTKGRAEDGTLSNNGAGIWTDSSLTLEDSSVFENIADNNGGGFYCDGSGSGNTCSPVLKNVTFTDNSADTGGGAMFNNGMDGASNPSLTNVTFSGNSSGWYGGAMHNYGWHGESSPSLNDVTFSDNSSVYYGGAMYNDGFRGESSPNLTNVTFSGNTAGDHGGAMHNNGHDGKSNPSLTNVVFSGNSADYGGAMFNYGRLSGTSSPSLTHVTFSGNAATESGGAMYNFGYDGTSSPEVYNSILWNNQDSSGTGKISSTIRNIDDATINLTHSLIQASGGSNNWQLDNSFVDGGGNIDKNPKFVTPVNPSKAPTTAGNLRLKVGSPAIDAGNNIYVEGVFQDLEGWFRKVDGDRDGTITVDMGAHEYQIDYPFKNYLPWAFFHAGVIGE
jgi:predicted outer membrane repeat protein